MSNSRRSATIFGAVGGSAISLALFAFFLGVYALHSPVLDGGSAFIEVTSGSLYLLVLVLGALGGLLIGAVGYGVGVSADPEADRFPLRYLLPVASASAAILAYAVLRIGVGGFGTIEGGVVTIGALRMTVTVLLMGAVAGGITSGIAVALARPELFEFGGEAWPSSPREVARAMMSAVSAPLVAAVVAAAFAIPLSLVLIELEGDAATVVFSVVGALVLGGTTLVATRPWEQRADRPDEQE